MDKVTTRGGGIRPTTEGREKAEEKKPSAVREDNPRSFGARRKYMSKVRAQQRFRAAEKASLVAGTMVREMREAAGLTVMKLSEAMECRVSYLSDIEHQRVRQTPGGEMKHLKVSLELLFDIAQEIGCELKVTFVPPQGR